MKNANNQDWESKIERWVIFIGILAATKFIAATSMPSRCPTEWICELVQKVPLYFMVSYTSTGDVYHISVNFKTILLQASYWFLSYNALFSVDRIRVL